MSGSSKDKSIMLSIPSSSSRLHVILFTYFSFSTSFMMRLNWSFDACQVGRDILLDGQLVM
jgi:hypothetical protein